MLVSILSLKSTKFVSFWFLTSQSVQLINIHYVLACTERLIFIHNHVISVVQ